jgi:uncharacterized protein YbjQ (UPF0145 family)
MAHLNPEQAARCHGIFTWFPRVRQPVFTRDWSAAVTSMTAAWDKAAMTWPESLPSALSTRAGWASDPVQGAENGPRVTPRSGRPGASSCTYGRQGMLLTTTSTLQDRHIDDYKGVVSGEAILGANAFRDMFAGIRDIVGGRSAAYERELQKAKDLAIREMVERARDTGANAVIGIDLDYETVGQNGSMLMVTASGTAVVVT